MIIIMNILISLIGLVGIIFARNIILVGIGKGIKHHFIILLLKLISTTIVISIFLMYTDRHAWLPLILTGMINLILFHFIEAYLTQKHLVYQRGNNV